jgi:hypothetical protein
VVVVCCPFGARFFATATRFFDATCGCVVCGAVSVTLGNGETDNLESGPPESPPPRCDTPTVTAARSTRTVMAIARARFASATGSTGLRVIETPYGPVPASSRLETIS